MKIKRQIKWMAYDENIGFEPMYYGNTKKECIEMINTSSVKYIPVKVKIEKII